MRRNQGTLARIRPGAGPLMLGVFLLATQLAPLAHLAGHRDDHTHGPELPSPAGADAGADHDPFEEHDHFEELDHLDDHHDDGGRHDHAADLDHAEDTDVPGHHGAPSPPHRHSNDHGKASAAHFGLALLQGPPPPFLPPPAETLASPPDAVLHGRCVAPRPQPPARGPPRLT